jgi:hypothetical protein
MSDQARTKEAPAATRGAFRAGGTSAKAQGVVVAGVVLVALVLFLVYSFSLKEWCEARQQGWNGGAWGGVGFGGAEIGECVRQKSWFSF